MTKLIDKDALVAKIEKRREKHFNSGGSPSSEYCYEDDEILSIINTLEVKEVDLESEIKKIQKEYKTIEEYEGYPCTMYAGGIEWIAKHFFELGIKVNNEKEK